MVTDPEHVADDLPAYALDALDVAEQARVAVHLATCARCTRLLAEYRAVVGLLPYGLPLEAPPPAAETTLLARARERQRSRVGGARRRRVGVWRGQAGVALQRWRWVAVTAAVVGLLLWNVHLQQQRSDGDEQSDAPRPLDLPDDRVVTLAGSMEAPGSSAHLLLSADGAHGWLVVSGLPVPPPGRAYQLWFVRPDQSRASGGVFRVDARGEAVVAVVVPGPLDQFIRAGVTEEPETGSPAPTGRNVLAGPL